MLRYEGGAAVVAVLGTAAIIGIDTISQEQSVSEQRANSTHESQTTPGPASRPMSTPSNSGNNPLSGDRDASDVSEHIDVQNLIAADHGVLDTAPAFVSAVEAEDVTVID